MFISKRVLFFKSSKDEYLLFCGNSNSFYEIDKETVPAVQKLINENDDSYLPEDVKNEFIKSGVIINESDESMFNRFKFLSYQFRFESETLDLTLTPTMACNFNCSYCCEGDYVKNINMSSEVIDAIVRLISLKKYQKLHITWYGGEPLCAWNKIVELNEKIQNLEIPVIEQDLITNGSLFDEEKIKYTLDKKFRMVQITLDGDELTQNSRRPMKNGGNSYQEIMKNLDVAYNYCKENNLASNIRIRINVDRTNADNYHNLHKMLLERFNNFFYIYPAFVKKNSQTDCHAKNCLDFKESAGFILDQADKYDIFTHYLFPRVNFLIGCPMQKVNTYVIDTDGNMYKCWNDIYVKNRVIGNVLTGIKDTYNVVQQYVINNTGFENKNCKDCLFLYSCMGGCPRARMTNDELKTILNPVCSVIKNKPEKFLEAYYELKKKSNNK